MKVFVRSRVSKDSISGRLCQIFHNNLDSLIGKGHEGKYAVVGLGGEIDIRRVEEDVIEFGYEKYGVHRLFYVMEIERVESVFHMPNLGLFF